MRHVVFLASALLCTPAIAQTCGEWTLVDTPSPGSRSNILIDVAALSPAAAVAVGNFSDGVLAPQPLVLRWNGAAWSRVQLPPTAALGTFPQVQGVARGAGGAAWVVGYIRTPAPMNQLPLLMRFVDGAWESAATPTLRPQNTHPFGPRGGTAREVVALTETDVWVVGSAAGYGDATATSVPLALHFDGGTWSDVPVPLIGNRHHEFVDVSASASDNVWAVGNWRNLSQPYKALVARWDGAEWTLVPNPGEGAGDGDAQAVIALAPDDVWVSGSFNGGTANLMHWNGSAWQTFSGISPGMFANFAASGPNDIWASCALNATFYHYDGVAWSAVPSNAIPGSTYVLRGYGLDVLDGCHAVSVGAYSNGVTQFASSEVMSPSGCPSDWNGDGGVDGDDVIAFFADWDANGADVNGDGGTDGDDIIAFFAGWDAGC